jgi:hypothetical protein
MGQPPNLPKNLRDCKHILGVAILGYLSKLQEQTTSTVKNVWINWLTNGTSCGVCVSRRSVLLPSNATGVVEALGGTATPHDRRIVPRKLLGLFAPPPTTSSVRLLELHPRSCICRDNSRICLFLLISRITGDLLHCRTAMLPYLIM